MRPESVDVEIVRPLRAQVLRPGESGEGLAFDGDHAPGTLHAAVLVQGRVVGVASVMRDRHPREPLAGDWRIRGMASSVDVRGRGIGASLLAFCEAHARGEGGVRLWCNARIRARAFYERAGFSVEGEVFELPRIGAHYLMSKSLQQARYSITADR
jgi:GNAT superfamily N-acetyltransferase